MWRQALMLKDEERAVAYIVNPNYSTDRITEAAVQNIIQNFPLEFVVSNKLLLLLYDKLESAIDKYGSAEFQKIKKIMQKEKENVNCLMDEISNLVKVFNNECIDFLVFKTIKSLQCEITDIDILVINNGELNKARNVLKNLRYHTEPSKKPLSKKKNMYFKIENGKEIAVDFHSKISYGGVILDKDKLWRRRKEIEILNSKIYVPSLEDEILIHVAHILFENGELTLYDVLYFSALLSKNPDINYILEATTEKGFFLPFIHLLYATNMIYNYLYNENMESPFISIANGFHNKSKIFRALFKIENRTIEMPFPFTSFTIFCFLYKLFYDLKHLNFKEIAACAIDFFLLAYSKVKCMPMPDWKG